MIYWTRSFLRTWRGTDYVWWTSMNVLRRLCCRNAQYNHYKTVLSPRCSLLDNYIVLLLLSTSYLIAFHIRFTSPGFTVIFFYTFRARLYAMGAYLQSNSKHLGSEWRRIRTRIEKGAKRTSREQDAHCVVCVCARHNILCLQELEIKNF